MTQKEVTVENKLRLLYDLQLIDSRIDQIRGMQGELPVEIENLNNEITQVQTSIQKINDELKELKDNIKIQKNIIDNANAFIKKYSEQQKNVRNNREYNSITKEIEYQELEIQLAEKNIKKFEEQIAQKQENIETMSENFKDQEDRLATKKSDLDVILKDTIKEEKKLSKKSKEYREKIEEKLIRAYDKLRSNFKNGLAVVSVEKGASEGSFIMVPSQVQLDIMSRKRIITDEYSSRILVDAELAQEERERMDKIL